MAVLSHMAVCDLYEAGEASAESNNLDQHIKWVLKELEQVHTGEKGPCISPNTDMSGSV